MKSSKSVRLIIGVIVALMLVSGLVGCNKTNVQVNEVVDNTNKTEENIRTKRTLQEISGDYTLEEANLDKAFIIGKDNLPQNKTVLNSFIDDLSTNKESSLRVVMETEDSLLYVLDIETSGDVFVVTQNNIQMSGEVVENIYSRAEGYSFADTTISLEDGLLLETYSLTKENLEESIELFAFLKEETAISGDSEVEILVSGEIVD